ncbi:MAG TPA: 16S rRNA (guanine(966)-N(2))-methyltransferase RsmD [Burkholderiales bacterium]|nr:16S rRNA (guanine(966)-N(2))-methyltransferase RsmD [Burkholderiales bacterium]
MKSNKIRIIGGEWRSRIVRFPDAKDLRPTPDRMRETLFNWLGQDLTGRVCLDLFAGSGALGFEAASRGARRVVMIERDAAVHRALDEARSALGARQVELLRADAFGFLASDGQHYDVVFLDPPFRENWLPRLLPMLAPRLATEARIYLESPQPPDALPDGYAVLKRARAGQVHGLLIKYAAP